MDGVLAFGGCDKNMPGGMMAMVRMNVPGIYVYAGTIKPGRWKGEKLTIVSPFEAVGAFTAGKMKRGGLRRHREERLPVGGRLRRHVHRKHDVVLVRGAGHEPARLIADGLAGRREGGLRRRVRARAGRGDPQRT